MKSLLRSSGKFSRFQKDTDGSASVEFVLWMPVFVALLMLTADASLLFMNQSNYWSVSQSTARLVSRHAMDEAAAEDYAQQQAAWGGAVPTADVTITGSTVTVNLSAPASQLSIFNALGFASGLNIDASITHSMEPT